MKQRAYIITPGLCQRRKYNDYINLQADFSNMLGYENIQQKRSHKPKQHLDTIQEKNKSSIESIVYDANYNQFRNRTAYNSCWNAQIGAKRPLRRKSVPSLPCQFQQILKHRRLPFTRRKLPCSKRGMLDCGIKGVWHDRGRHDAKNETGSRNGLADIDEYPQRKDFTGTGIEYITSDKIAGGVNVRYTYFLNKEKGMNLYAIGMSIKKVHQRPVRTVGLDNLQATIGLSF